jgi:hypothetical protein
MFYNDLVDDIHGESLIPPIHSPPLLPCSPCSNRLLLLLADKALLLLPKLLILLLAKKTLLLALSFVLGCHVEDRFKVCEFHMGEACERIK